MQGCLLEASAFIDVLVSQYDPSTVDWTDIVHPLTPKQRQLQRDFSARLSMAECYEVMTELNRRVLALRGIDTCSSSDEMIVSIIRQTDGSTIRRIHSRQARVGLEHVS